MGGNQRNRPLCTPAALLREIWADIYNSETAALKYSGDFRMKESRTPDAHDPIRRVKTFLLQRKHHVKANMYITFTHKICPIRPYVNNSNRLHKNPFVSNLQSYMDIT